MISYYDSYAQQYLHAFPPPGGIRIDVIEFDEYPGTVFLMAYASDMASVKESAVHEFTAWINKTLKHLNGLTLLGKYAFYLEHK